MRAFPDALTPRELELLRLLAQGKFTREIAAAMGIEDSTVRSSISVIFDKVQVRNRAELIVWAVRRGVAKG